MKLKLIIFSILIFVFCYHAMAQKPIPNKNPTTTTKPPVVKERIYSTIAFGSCNKEDKPQDMWTSIVQNNPDLWIWLGDIVYADTEDPTFLANKFNKLKTNELYKNLLKKTRVIGVYDDHDFGVNNGGKEYKMKKQSRDILFNFLEIPKDSPFRKREGAYQSCTFKSTNNNKIKVILLDTRYFRDELEETNSSKFRFYINKNGDILGKEQWTWLENELKTSDANLNIICTSFQLIPDDHPFEKWSNFPEARKHFFEVLYKIKPKNVLLLSGDRHFAEFSCMDLKWLPYTLVEVTSSGMTHVREQKENTESHYRCGEFADKMNFGLLKVDWDEDNIPTVTVQIRGHKNALLIEKIINF